MIFEEINIKIHPRSRYKSSDHQNTVIDLYFFIYKERSNEITS